MTLLLRQISGATLIISHLVISIVFLAKYATVEDHNPFGKDIGETTIIFNIFILVMLIAFVLAIGVGAEKWAGVASFLFIPSIVTCLISFIKMCKLGECHTITSPLYLLLLIYLYLFVLVVGVSIILFFIFRVLLPIYQQCCVEFAINQLAAERNDIIMTSIVTDNKT